MDCILLEPNMLPTPVTKAGAATAVVVSRPVKGAGRHDRPGSPMSSETNSEVAPDHWWLHRRTDDEHFVFAYEFSKSVLCLQYG